MQPPDVLPTSCSSRRSLMRFLHTLDIPLIATLRDTQNYVRCAESGVGIHELPRWQVRQDLEAWEGLMQWLDRRYAPTATESSGLATGSSV